MKNVIPFIIVLLTALSLHAQNPVFQWVKSNKVYAITGDSSTSRSASINKLDSLGNFVWAKAFVRKDTLFYTGISIAYSIDVDSGGNIFCSGGVRTHRL